LNFDPDRFAAIPSTGRTESTAPTFHEGYGFGWLLAPTTVRKAAPAAVIFVKAVSVRVSADTSRDFPDECSCPSSKFFGLPCECVVWVLGSYSSISFSRTVSAGATLPLWRSDPNFYVLPYVAASLRTKTSDELKDVVLQLQIQQTTSQTATLQRSLPLPLNESTTTGTTSREPATPAEQAAEQLRQTREALLVRVQSQLSAILVAGRQDPDVLVRLESAIAPLYAEVIDHDRKKRRAAEHVRQPLDFPAAPTLPGAPTESSGTNLTCSSYLLLFVTRRHTGDNNSCCSFRVSFTSVASPLSLLF